MKQKLLLLDANVVIECYRVSIWETLLDKTEVCVPSIVAHDEAFYSQNGRVISSINLPVLIENNKIKEVTADISDYQSVQDVLSKFPIAELHAGELEALAVMHSGKLKDYKFSSGDKTAIHAMCVLGLAEFGICLEKILKSYGFQKKLKKEFKEDYFNHHVSLGNTIRLQNENYA